MSTKYGSIRTEAWKWTHEEDNPRMSDHLLFGEEDEVGKWDKRTPPGSCSPEHAWEHGIDVSFMADAFGDKKGQIPDKAVYWTETTEWGTYDVVLLCVNETVTTVYRVDSMRDEPVRTALFGLRELVDDE